MKRYVTTLRRTLAVTAALASLTVAGVMRAQQTPDAFNARLSWVPISSAERNDVAGRGSATARLSRSRLLVSGSFEGLPAAATLATLRQGAAIGASGPVIAQLKVKHAVDGTFSGRVELNSDQRAALLAGQLYIQVHAERGVPPDNAVLRGWLLADQRAASPRSRN